MNTQTIINIDSIISNIWSELKKLKSRITSLESNSGSSSSYKVYTALMSQSGTDDPVVIELENTIGEIVWTRNDVGFYVGTLTGAFTTDKTWCSAIPGNYNGNAIGTITLLKVPGVNDEVRMYLYDPNGTDTDINDDGGYEVSIEIRVYN